MPVRGDVTIGEKSWNGRTVYEATVVDGKNHLLPRLIEPTVTGVASIAMHIEGFEPVQTPLGWVYYRQLGCASSTTAERRSKRRQF